MGQIQSYHLPQNGVFDHELDILYRMTRFLRSSNCPNQHYKGRERWGLILSIQHIFTMDRLNTRKFRETALKIHWLMTILAEASRYIISCGHDFSWSKNKATSRRSAENTQYLHCSCATIMQGVGTVYNSNNYWIVTQLSLIWRTRSVSLKELTLINWFFCEAN